MAGELRSFSPGALENVPLPPPVTVCDVPLPPALAFSLPGMPPSKNPIRINLPSGSTHMDPSGPKQMDPSASTQVDPSGSNPAPGPPVAPADLEKPSILLKPSEKGIDLAKKRLRAFSIQRKQSMAPAPISKATNLLKGVNPLKALSGSTAGASKTETPEKAKQEKPKKMASTPTYMKIQEKTIAEIEQLKKGFEVSDLGIPLGLVPRENLALPWKGMPPIALLAPEQVSKFMEKAKKAKEQGKDIKFSYQEFFPDYENPFQKGRKKVINPDKDPKNPENKDVKGYHRHRDFWKRDTKSKWDDKDQYSRSKKEPTKREHTKKDKDPKETEVNLSDYVVCDSWSLDTEDKTDDGTPKSETKSVKVAEERVQDEVTKLEPDPESLPKKDNDEDPKTILIETLIRPITELPKEKLRPVVDEFIYDIDDNSSNDSVIDVTEKMKSKQDSDVKKINLNADVEVPITNSKTVNKENTQTALLDNIPMPGLKEKKEHSVKHSSRKKDRLISSKSIKKERNSLSPVQQSKESLEWSSSSRKPLDSRDRSSSNRSNDSRQKLSSPSTKDIMEKSSSPKEGREVCIKMEITSPLRGSSKICESVDYETPERLKMESDKYMIDYEPSPERRKNAKSESKKLEKVMEKDIPTLEIDCEPLTPDHCEGGTLIENYDGSRSRSENLQSYADQPNLSQVMKECLDTWNFVLKICQPLLFRHDRNKCFRETKVMPPVWFTENPRNCQCVKDRSIVYEELDLTKSDLADKVYGCEQTEEATPPPYRDWYPKEQYFLSERYSGPNSNWETDSSNESHYKNRMLPNKPPVNESRFKKTVGQTPAKPRGPVVNELKSTYSDDARNSLDREYEKFMEAVWPPIKESNVLKSPMPKKEEHKKVRETTSELGTSMDESVVSMEDEVRVTKKKDKEGKRMKVDKASSEYWSQESDVADIAKSEIKTAEKTESQKKEGVKKNTSKKSLKTSSSQRDSDSEDSSDEKILKKPKEAKEKTKTAIKKTAKLVKQKSSRKRRLEKKKKLKKLKDKRMKKINKLKEKIDRSSEQDDIVEEIIKKGKLKKKGEVKSKAKKKTTKTKITESKKKKSKVVSSSSSSSSSTSSSSSSSSDSEEERVKRSKKKAKRKQKEAAARAEKEKKKAKKKAKRKPSSDSYSEEEEEFDMNILNNIKMEQISDDDVSKPVQEMEQEFSPRRKSPVMKEIVSVSELHSDFVGNTFAMRKIKQEKIDCGATPVLPEVQERSAKETTPLGQPSSPGDSRSQDKASVRSAEGSLSQDSSNFGEFKGSIDSNSDFPNQKPTPEDSIASPISQDSASSFRTKPYEKDDSFLRPSSQNSNYSFRDVITSSQGDAYPKRVPQGTSYEPENKAALEVIPQDVSYETEKKAQENIPQGVYVPENIDERVPQDVAHKPEKRDESVGKTEKVNEELRSTEEMYKSHEADMFEHGSYYQHGDASKDHYDYDSYDARNPDYMDFSNSLQAGYPTDEIQKMPPSTGTDYVDYASEARPIETVVSATCGRGEIKCDWRPARDSVKPRPARASRWGALPPTVAPPEPAVAPAASAPGVYPIRSVLDPRCRAPAPRLYRIETISTVRGAGETDSPGDYDGAYADMYGESDRLQYGDCFAAEAPAPPAGHKRGRLSLDDRIGLIVQQEAVLGKAPKVQTPPEPVNETGILTNRLSPSGREVRGRGARRARAARSATAKRVRFADGYNPGQDSDTEEPPMKKRRLRRRYGCAWPCPASHPDHVPLWDALPPPPPPGSPPPPAAPPAPPASLLRRRRRADELADIKSEEPMAKITRLPKGLGLTGV